MKNILAIGNSFSEDATKYLHQMAKAAGIETKVVNLYIGGCPLERHWRNIETGEAAYQYQLNGRPTERQISIPEALQEEKWDYIVTQQASHDSGWMDTYEPFLGLLVDYLKERAPQAEILLQETWAYEIDSPHANFMRYHRDQKEMYERLKKCYSAMAEKYGLRLIPSGDVIQKARQQEPFRVEEGGLSLCRDGFHMSIPCGRYLLACVWTKTLFSVRLPEDPRVLENGEEEAKEAAEKEALLRRIRQIVEEEMK
ncbi:MAG TPA: DUF4886 domain-containing protein [Candidatus Eisenbergiella intestinipullorum]|nr:DUF4886 domain-containing protein [Candidatus Eisenbergiella intestinipullorum]